MLTAEHAKRFDLLAELGQGAQGVVFKAYDRLEKRVVALKTLAYRSPEAVYELKREFRSVARIRHPHLVQLYDLFVEESSAFFTMEFLDGVDVVRYVRAAGQTDHQRLDRCAEHIANGLEALHAADRIHRDLKPSNVMVEESGRTVILDFGLMTSSGPNPLSISDASGFAGTLIYMAPEAIANRPSTPARDWYAVGAMIYEALTGAPPFAGTQAQIVRAKYGARIPGLDGLGRWAPVVQALLHIEPEERAGGELIPRPNAPDRVRHLAAPFLVGRSDELSSLEALQSGEGPKFAALSGPGGIGKTTLVTHFAKSAAAAGAVVLTGRCRPNESVAFEAIDGVVDGISRELRDSPQVLSFDKGEAAPLAKLFPVLKPFLPVEEIVVSEDLAPAQLRRRAATALRRVLHTLSERAPLTIWIDDAQWASQDSAAFFQMLIDPQRAPKVTWVVSYRPEGDRPMVAGLDQAKKAWLEAGFGWMDLAVEPLGSEAISSLMELRLTDARQQSVRSWVEAESGGNPFFALELCRVAEMPELDAVGKRLDEVVRSRIQTLGPVARSLLASVAIAGRALRRGVLVRCAEDAKAADLALGQLLAEQFLREAAGIEGAAFDVYHDRIRDAVEEELSPDEARSFHDVLATALLLVETDPRGRVRHFFEAGRTKEAVEQAVQAARVSSEHLEFERAAEFMRRALGHGHFEVEARLTHQRTLAEALSNAGHGRDSAECWLRVAADTGADDARYARRRAAALFVGSGHLKLGYAVLDEVLSGVGLALPKGTISTIAGISWLRLRIALRGFKRKEPRSDPALAEHVDLCWDVSEMLSMVDTFRGAYFQARNVLASLRLQDPYRLARALGIETAYLASSGWYPETKTAEMGAIARRAGEDGGNPHGLAVAIGGYAVARYLQGDWRRALDECEEADRIYRTQCLGVTWERDTTALFILMALLRLGEFERTQERAHQVLLGALDRGDLFLDTYTSIRILAPLSVAHGRLDEGERTVEDAMKRWTSVGYHVQEFWADHARTSIALHRGDLQTARALVDGTRKNLARSMLWSVQEFRVETMCHDVRISVGEALAGDSSRLRPARRMVRKMSRARVRWPRAFATVLAGSIAAVSNEDERAVRLWRQAAAELDALEMGVDAAVTRRVLGSFIGGDEGSALERDADRTLLSRGLSSPGALAASVLPSLPVGHRRTARSRAVR